MRVNSISVTCKDVESWCIIDCSRKVETNFTLLHALEEQRVT